MKTKYFILILIVFSWTNLFSQIQRDQDLITLKNGFQLLGFIIEQQPGTAVKIFRPTQNDTVLVKMEEIDKLSKIMVNTFSEKTITQKDTSLKIGRYNNKKNVYQLSYLFQAGGLYSASMQGAGFAYYRNYRNYYYAGISGSYLSGYNESIDYQTGATKVYSYSRFQLVFENKLRLSRRLQNKRFTTLLGVNAGYVFEGSYTNTNIISSDNSKIRKEDFVGNYMLQTNLSFKINPDNNSGFIIEPGLIFYKPKQKLYNSDGFYLGYQNNPIYEMFSLRMSYFF